MSKSDMRTILSKGIWAVVTAGAITFSSSALADETEKPKNTGKVSVAGEVKKPGWVQLGKKKITLLEVLKVRGGLTVFASGNLRVYRDGKKSNYDYRKLKEEPSKSPVIKAGDRVVVMHKRVKRPL